MHYAWQDNQELEKIKMKTHTWLFPLSCEMKSNPSHKERILSPVNTSRYFKTGISYNTVNLL